MMDLWALSLRSGGGGAGHIWGWNRKGAVVRQAPCWRKFFGGEEEGISGAVLEIRISTRYGGRRTSGYRSLDVRATGKKKNDDFSSPGSDDPSIPEDDNSYGSNSPSDKKDFEEGTYKSHHTNIDWRTFRANLVAQEQVHLEDSNALTADNASHESTKLLGLKWAHPIPMPETGCVLIATDKLDGVRNFERTVVLLLRLGTNDGSEGPFGIIINCPFHKKIKHLKATNHEQATTFADCSLYFGGPLVTNTFLLRSSEKSSPFTFEQVVPGIYFGTRSSLIEATELVKEGFHRPQDFRFFVGYAGWQLDQLIEEIESDYWIIAACSSDLIFGASSDCMWEEILQLMGGPYSELSRKPKQDS